MWVFLSWIKIIETFCKKINISFIWLQSIIEKENVFLKNNLN